MWQINHCSKIHDVWLGSALLHYLLKQKEMLDAVHWYAVHVQQAVELETQFPLGFGFWVFTGEATDGDIKEQQRRNFIPNKTRLTSAYVKCVLNIPSCDAGSYYNLFAVTLRTRKLESVEKTCAFIPLKVQFKLVFFFLRLPLPHQHLTGFAAEIIKQV